MRTQKDREREGASNNAGTKGQVEGGALSVSRHPYQRGLLKREEGI